MKRRLPAQGAGSAGARRPRGHRRGRRAAGFRERGHDVGQIGLGHGLVQRNLHDTGRRIPEIDAPGLSRAPHARRAIRSRRETKRIEVGAIRPRANPALERFRQAHGLVVHSAGNVAQPIGPVVHAIDRRHVGEQRLGRADVRRRLLAADVLFARLQRHAVGAAAAAVHRDADDPARRLANERLARREERGMRSAVPQRHAKPLGVADDHVRAGLSGRGRSGPARAGRSDGDEHAGVVRPLERAAPGLERRRGRLETGRRRRRPRARTSAPRRRLPGP